MSTVRQLLLVLCVLFCTSRGQSQQPKQEEVEASVYHSLADMQVSMSCLSWNWNFASGEISSPPEEDSDVPKTAKTTVVYCNPES